MSWKRCSPEPSRTGRTARCSSSIRAARRYWRMVVDAATEADVAAAGGGARLLPARHASSRDKVKLRASCHPAAARGVMRQHEDRRVIRRLLAHQPFQLSSGHGPRTGPNMLRPRIQAPIPVKPCSASGVVDARLAIVMSRASAATGALWKSHSMSSGPATPSGLWRSWFGPAPYPSMEIAKLGTRSLTRHSSLSGAWRSGRWCNDGGERPSASTAQVPRQRVLDVTYAAAKTPATPSARVRCQTLNPAQ